MSEVYCTELLTEHGTFALFYHMYKERANKTYYHYMPNSHSSLGNCTRKIRMHFIKATEFLQNYSPQSPHLLTTKHTCSSLDSCGSLVLIGELFSKSLQLPCTGPHKPTYMHSVTQHDGTYILVTYHWSLRMSRHIAPVTELILGCHILVANFTWPQEKRSTYMNNYALWSSSHWLHTITIHVYNEQELFRVQNNLQLL